LIFHGPCSDADPMSDVPIPMTVLVVEDESDLREMVVEELTDAGFHVLEAEIGEAALAIIDSGRPIDVLFTDVRLPGSVDGWEIARHARDTFPAIHVIYTSGYAPDRSAQVPGSLYVSKPCLPSTIIAEIRRLRGAAP
jgi:CheY-like chemotaxis protein